MPDFFAASIQFRSLQKIWKLSVSTYIMPTTEGNDEEHKKMILK